MELRWGIDGPTVEFEKALNWSTWCAIIGDLEVEIISHPAGYQASLASANVGPLYVYGGCQQTALDRLHARLREVAAEITAAL